jgi:hypothetical protein
MLHEAMHHRFLAVMRDNTARWPDWLRDFREASHGEELLGIHVVAQTGKADMSIHITDHTGGIDWFNREYPGNGVLVLLLYRDFSDERIMSKSLKFLEREYVTHPRLYA